MRHLLLLTAMLLLSMVSCKKRATVPYSELVGTWESNHLIIKSKLQMNADMTCVWENYRGFSDQTFDVEFDADRGKLMLSSGRWCKETLLIYKNRKDELSFSTGTTGWVYSENSVSDNNVIFYKK